MSPESDHPLSDTLREFAARVTRDPQQPFGMSGVALQVQAWDGEPITQCTGVDANGSAIGADSVFCLASVGKLVVALLVLELVDSQRISLDAPVAEHLPNAPATLRGVTVGQLLSHRSGMPPVLLESAVPYNSSVRREELLAACLSAVPAPNGRVVYSDIGYGLLGHLLEHVWDTPLDAVIVSRLNDRLGTSLRMTPAEGPRLVAVEHVNGSGSPAFIAPMNSPFWRALTLPWGGVHGTVADMIAVALEFSERGSLLSPELRALATTDPNQGQLPGGIEACGAHLGIAGAAPVQWSPCPWGLGPELRGEKAPHWTPREASASSFGHVGTSGTLVWCDPVARVAWAMAGTRCSASGWLFRHGPTFGRLALRASAPTN